MHRARIRSRTGRHRIDVVSGQQTGKHSALSCRNGGKKKRNIMAAQLRDVRHLPSGLEPPLQRHFASGIYIHDVSLYLRHGVRGSYGVILVMLFSVRNHKSKQQISSAIGERAFAMVAWEQRPPVYGISDANRTRAYRRSVSLNNIESVIMDSSTRLDGGMPR
jgi:hypothetical protein